MFGSVNCEYLIEIGLLDKDAKEKYIELLLKDWTKNLDVEEYGDLTIGELRLIKEGIRAYFGDKDISRTLKFTSEDLYWVASEFVYRGICNEIAERMPQLKVVVDAEPMLEDDDYYYEASKMEYCIGKACGLEQDSCGDFSWNFMDLLHINFDTLFEMLKVCFINGVE